MEPFDIVRNPLAEGPCLIEAGAGTGKTYALTSIFLRLLLEKHIPPDRILIVTFTTAATAELRDRLRRQLMAVRRFIDGEGPLDDTLRELVERAGPAVRSREAVVMALREFDRIAIFTIHGFCQRLLTEMAFETGSPFTLELQADPSAWIQSAADDYWREILHDAVPEIAAYALDRHRSPESLARLYQRFRTPDLRIIPAVRERPRIDVDRYRQAFARLHRQWPAVRDEIAVRLESPALKGNIYGSLKPPSGAPPALTKRKQKVAAWCRLVDFFLRRETAAFPPSPALIYFSSAKIVAATRKGQSPPAHPFFDDCQSFNDAATDLHASLEEWATAFRYGFFAYADRKLERLKQDRQTIFYDDLLTRTAKALADDRGRRLAAAVRLRYRAALVDEFQDTDSTQYQIFKSLFACDDHILVMIGDPKQAIYGFRGADIFSYLEASRHARHRFTLFHNWRSRPGLIRAINALFENHPCPFLIPQIDYHPAVAARAQVESGRRAQEQTAMTFWLLTNDGADDHGNGGRFTKAQATEKILAAITGEVGRLLQTSSEDAHGAAGCAARDIAILVRTNRQARQVKACMTTAGIPAVIHNAGNVFGTPEADELAHVLRAVAQPNDERRLKTALTTLLFGWTGEDLDFSEPPPRWAVILERFLRYHAIWQDVGFYPFFRRMLTENSIAERLLLLTDGERRLTNLLHLGELLNQAATQQRTGLRGTLKWMDEQRAALSGSFEEQQLRMESDAQALTILTIHKSKGLEFPIVFCPFCWESDPGRRDWPLFHDPAADMRRTIDIATPAAADHQRYAQTERLAESLRLLYVAVTRAKERCFLVWGALPSAESSALTYLLDPGERSGRATRFDSASHRWVKSEKPYDDEDAAAALDRLTKAAGGRIAVRPLPEGASVRRRLVTAVNTLRAERAMRRRFDPHWA
ncbi:MAG: UvrD-helicase domain-containing protein, partial [Desulfobacterales bacterium]